MNTVDAKVISISDEGPWQAFGKWWVTVDANAWGHSFTHDLMFNTLEEAQAVEVGQTFLA